MILRPADLLALGSVSELVQHVVQHGGQSVRQLRPEEGLVYVLSEVVEHVHRLPGEGQVGPALSLVLRQLAGPAGLLLLALIGPLDRVVHVLLHHSVNTAQLTTIPSTYLNVVNPFQRIQTLV